MEYRILRREKTNGLGESVEITYNIQMKFLLWWFDVSTKACSYPSQKETDDLSTDILLRRNVFFFDNERDCREHLTDFFIDPFRIYYKGNIIERRYHYSREIVYVNRSNITGYTRSKEGPYMVEVRYPMYECRISLEDLMQEIDRRIISTNESIISVNTDSRND
ncbi:hypothetical protein CMU99_16270 [Elizabethkingia anophelis]|nr:hypothetical protein [Elizabethkingia anophelis]